MSHPRIRRRRPSIFIETIERRILFAAAPTTIADFGTSGIAHGGMVVDHLGNIFGTTQATSSSYGTLYEIPVGENSIKTLVQFTGNNGSDPNSFLSIDSNGNIFGTTAAGGQDGFGVVWELPANATSIIRLASYSGTDGNQLGNGLAIDAVGNIFVIAQAGSNGNGAILKLPAGGSSLSVFAAGFSTGDDPIGRPVIDSVGDLFGVTVAAGINGDGSIYEISANGTALPVASFTMADATPQGDLLIDSNGDIFGTTVNTSSGQNLSTVFELPGGSLLISTLATNTSSNGSFIEPGLARHSAGNLFASTTGAFGQSSTVFKIPINGNSYGQAINIATIPEVDDNGSNINAATGFLTFDAAGNLYGTTQSTAPGNDDTLFEIAGAGVTQFGNHLIITQQPSQTVVNEVITPAVVVEVDDSNNNLVYSDDSAVSLRIATGPAGAAPGGTLIVNAVNGIATFSNLNLNTIGNYTFTFTAPAMSSATTTNFRIIKSPLDGSHLVFTLPPSPSTVAGTKMQEFKVTAELPSGDVSSATKGTVTISIISGPAIGKILGPKSAPLKKGIALFKNVSFDIAGTYTLAATDTASLDATPQLFTIIATTPKKMLFSQQPVARISAAQVFSVSLEIKDKFGNLATNDASSVSLTLTGSSKNADLQGTPIEPVLDGIAAFDDLSILTPGHYTLKAADPADALKANSKGFRII